MNLKIIARIHNDFPDKFGIPRQSGLVRNESRIVFEKDYRDTNAVRGLEGFSHIWLLWGFSETPSDEVFRPTVRPPRLGGSKRVGVFATRSPFRPNPIGLSSVELKETIETDEGPVLVVIGADLLDGTPIYDIKPYLPEFDSHPEARAGFVDSAQYRTLEVSIDDEFADRIPDHLRLPLIQALGQDPRPHYQDDPDRIYGMKYADLEIKFKVCDGRLLVLSVE
ncbi:MAG: tRNA (N6-threonylcarbamoyladenosine(37)-N6)-methyltransferase TrmO [Spirochaetales bacterium]|nr:tRNA (N6-threonylcarbamoyladenosine(37)-N6)-methyltransferase TrmO [Spirochaetales bacterium]